MNMYDSIEYEGYRINVYVDEDALNPRTNFDNLGTIVYWHNRYILGDENGQKVFGTPGQFFVWAKENDVVWLPVYLYDHSGITISTDPFSSPWDSGQVGFIYVTRDTLKKEMIENRDDKAIEATLQAEINVFDQYLRGDVWGYVIEDAEGKDIESCWGFFGQDYMVEEAKGMIDYHIRQRETEENKEFSNLLEQA